MCQIPWWDGPANCFHLPKPDKSNISPGAQTLAEVGSSLFLTHWTSNTCAWMTLCSLGTWRKWIPHKNPARIPVRPHGCIWSLCMPRVQSMSAGDPESKSNSTFIFLVQVPGFRFTWDFTQDYEYLLEFLSNPKDDYCYEEEFQPEPQASLEIRTKTEIKTIPVRVYKEDKVSVPLSTSVYIMDAAPVSDPECVTELVSITVGAAVPTYQGHRGWHSVCQRHRGWRSVCQSHRGCCHFCFCFSFCSCLYYCLCLVTRSRSCHRPRGAQVPEMAPNPISVTDQWDV